MGTHSWDKIVNLVTFGVSVFENYNVATKSLDYEGTSCVLLCNLVEEIIDNNMNSSPTRQTSKRTGRIAMIFPVRKHVA